jgi:predicted ATPase/class 3 adenylate cyclase
MRYVFGDCILDPERYELHRAGVRIPVRSKVFHLLAYLITHRDRVVLKDELLARLWPQQFVGDAVLKSCIMTARKAVGDTTRRQRIIQTLHGHGYRFVAAVTTEDQPAPASAVLPGPSGASAPPALRAETRPDPGTGVPHTAVHPLEQEHKQVTVLWCTLAHATTLATRLDREAMHALMHAVLAVAQRTMQRYEGTITQYLGDGFLALFGAPVAHEDHARRAVLAALELQQQLGMGRTGLTLPQDITLAVCIGLHTGPVVVGYLDGDPLRLYTAVSETTQVATRLLSLAAPGTVVLSEPTYRLVCDEVWANPCGSLAVVATAAPVAVYTVQGVRRYRAGVSGHHTRDLSRFVGRVRELAILHERLAYAAQGQGQVVGLVGEPGMGKSRLLYEFAQSLRGQAVTYYEGHCLAYGSATPYLPVRTLLRQHCGITEADGPAAITARVRRAARDAEIASEETVALLLQLLDVPIETELVAQLSLQAQRTRTFALLRQLLLHASQRQPFVLAVENGHWLDATSEEWLTTLVERLPGASILLLVTYRPGYRPPWLEQSFATQLALPRLVPQDSLAIVQSVAQRTPLPAHLAQAIVARAGGNPFFLEELTWDAVEHGPGSVVPAIPETIQAVVAARIDRLPLTEKRLVQAAAVIGTDVPVPLLRAVTEMTEEDLAGSLRHLQAAEFLYETRLLPELTYTFKHVLTQEVAYNAVVQERRRVLHERVAQAIEGLFADRLPEHYNTLVHHYSHSGNSAKAVHYLARAGQQAVERSAYAEAVSHLTTALDLLATLPETRERDRQELAVQMALGMALGAPRGQAAPEVERLYSRARELCEQVGEPQQLFRVLWGLWRVYNQRGEYQAMRLLGEQIFDLARRLQDADLLLEAHHAMWGSLVFGGELVAAQPHLEHGLRFYEPQRHRTHAALYSGHDPGMCCRVHAALALWLRGYPDQAVASSQAALVLTQQLAHPLSLALALIWATMVHHLRGEAPLTQAHAEAAMTLATDQGFPQQWAQAMTLRGWVLAAGGQGEEGIAQIQQGLAAYQATGVARDRPYYLALLAEASIQAGRTAVGLEALGEALVTLAKSGGYWWEAELHRLKGELLLAHKDAKSKWVEAAECCYQACTMARRQQAKSLELRAAMSLSRLWQRQGKRAEACQVLADVYQWFTEGFETADLKAARALLEACTW